MPKAKAPKISKYDRSVIETKALRPYVPKDLRALFDHCLSLAAHSHKSGYAARAGRELQHARKLAKPPGAQDFSPLRYQVQFQSALQHARAPDDWSHLQETYKNRAGAEEHAKRIQASEAGMRVRVVAI